MSRSRRSPFPGMDPYIEACGKWEPFQQRLIGSIDDALAAALPAGYSSEVQQRRYVILGSERSEIIPDADVTGPRVVRKTRRRREALDGSLAVAAFTESEYREAFIEVQDAEEGHVVAVIEVLSPSNKRNGTAGWKKYVKKRRACIRSNAHFIELDLLLGGTRMRMADDMPDSPYYVLLCRQPDGPMCRVWPASYREPLPPLRIPLARGEPDVVLPLQPLVDDIYERHGYRTKLDDAEPLAVALPDAEAAWIRETASAAR